MVAEHCWRCEYLAAGVIKGRPQRNEQVAERPRVEEIAELAGEHAEFVDKVRRVANVGRGHARQHLFRRHQVLGARVAVQLVLHTSSEFTLMNSAFQRIIQPYEVPSTCGVYSIQPIGFFSFWALTGIQAFTCNPCQTLPICSCCTEKATHQCTLAR